MRCVLRSANFGALRATSSRTTPSPHQSRSHTHEANRGQASRNPARADTFERDRILPFVADIHDASSLAGLPEVDTVLYAVGFDRTGGQTIGDVFVEGLRNVLSQLPAPRGRLIYISSTGTYGQDDGQWVDEESPCHPVREGGKACLDAENLLLQEDPGFDRCRLRLAGIYGPGRIPRREELQAGKVISASPEGWLNLIHVDDAARVVIASADADSLPRVGILEYLAS